MIKRVWHKNEDGGTFTKTWIMWLKKILNKNVSTRVVVSTTVYAKETDARRLVLIRTDLSSGSTLRLCGVVVELTMSGRLCP
jgi:hypothetical protein